MPGYNVLNDELTRAVKQVVAQHLSSFMPRPKRGRRQRRSGGGGGGTTSVTKFGIVRQQAGASGRRAQNDGLFPGSLGKAQLLLPTMIAEQPAAGLSLEDSYIEIASLHLVPCRVGAIVLLHSDSEIKQATRWPTGQSNPNTTDAVVWAQLIHATDELYELPGHAPEKVLWLPTSATKGDDIRWDGGACPT